MTTGSLALLMFTFAAEAKFTVSQSGERFLVRNDDNCVAVFDMDGGVRLREEPSESSDAAAKGVRNGTRLRGLGECEEHHDTQWCRVQYKGDRGWPG